MYQIFNILSKIQTEDSVASESSHAKLNDSQATAKLSKNTLVSENISKYLINSFTVLILAYISLKF